MSNKLLFPGVSEKDIQKKQKAEQERAAAEAAAQQKEQERAAAEAAAQQKEQEHQAAVKAQEERKRDAYKKYIGALEPEPSQDFKETSGTVCFVASLSGAFSGVTALNYNCDCDSYPSLVFFGSVLAIISVAIAYIAVMKKKCRPFNTVDMMLELEKSGKKYNLNCRQVKRLVAASNDIIQKMSADNPFFFDMLMNGNITIKNPETYKKMASKIILGHLESHPADAQRILDIFDERSIPENVLEKVKAYQMTHMR